ncbi:substrate-binding domain-containing protein [Thaumasiovibrio sp. DFM-14]|uniref:substrate-binding domain-containing protein n=1 Tax=Thaumasiovibrio sp. DFM-14 TaxID=3384792 RepID=UPI00399F37E2
MHIKHTIFLVLLLFPALTIQAANRYWEYGDYLDLHPKQRALTEHFSALVDNDPIAFSGEVNKPITVSIVYPSEQISDYWVRNISAFTQRLNELGIPHEISAFFSSPNTNQRRQNEQLLEALQSEPDYLIFTLDTERHRIFIEHVLQSPTTKLILQNITTPIKSWNKNQPFFYVGFDHHQGTHLLADYFQSIFPDSATYNLLYFSPGYISNARGDTFINRLQPSQRYWPESIYYTRADQQSGYDATMLMLEQKADVDFIYACSTDIALGAAKALAEKNLNSQIMLNGWGGGSAELAALANGKIDVTVMRINDDAGVAMAEAIKLDLENHPVPLVYSGNLELITKHDSIEHINALKKRAFRYSDNQKWTTQ